MSHALRRISYATCDPSRAQFSFLAREPRGHLNLQYCHTFFTGSADKVSPGKRHYLHTLPAGAVLVVDEGRCTCSSRSPSLDVCPSHSPCLDVCPSRWPSLDVCPSRSPSLDVCPSHSPCLDVCPSRSSCLDVCPSRSPCLDVCPSHSPCLDVCPSRSPCLAARPSRWPCLDAGRRPQIITWVKM